MLLINLTFPTGSHAPAWEPCLPLLRLPQGAGSSKFAFPQTESRWLAYLERGNEVTIKFNKDTKKYSRNKYVSSKKWRQCQNPL